jgi:hypothetical protein
MTRRIVAAAGTAVLALSLYAGTALAAANPSGTGQPSQSCDDQTGTPAGFLTAGFANAESRYANPDAQGGLASGNSHVVSQYDVACFQVSQPH